MRTGSVELYLPTAVPHRRLLAFPLAAMSYDSLQVMPNPIDTAGGYGVQTYWRIVVNNQEVTYHARPFSASEQKAILHECLDCFSCGVCDLSVRRCDDVVVWFGDDADGHGFAEPGLKRGVAFLFDAAEYEELLGGGSTALLPELTHGEIQLVLSEQEKVDWRDGLYTIPALRNDLSGHTALRLLGQMITDHDGLRATTRIPTSINRLQIGLEIPGTPECVLEFGQLSSDMAIRLVSWPSFPLWLMGSSATQCLCEYLLEEFAEV